MSSYPGKREEIRKYVVAHFMTGNTYPYSIQDWLEDIRVAHQHSLDGFALNVGCETWQKDRVMDCYAAALQSQLPFKLFVSFDMTSISSKSQGDVDQFLEYFKHLAGHPCQLLCNGKVVISTFAGEHSRFGCGNLNDAWITVREALEKIAPVHFIPSFFIDPTRHHELTCIDGYFNWNGGWPVHLTPNSPPEEIRHPKLDADIHHLRHLGGKTFMAAVSPWFFTHYGPDSWNKNWIYRGDDWLFVRRWEQLITARDKVDIVQVLSWNDYGESHYIGPIKGAQPNSQAWVDGYPHDAWLDLNSYFARAFKTGRYPPVTKDVIYMWGRPHSKHACASDTVPRPNNWQLTDDAFWVIALAARPAILALSSGDLDEDTRSYKLHAGLTKICHPMIPEGTMRAEMWRDETPVAWCKPDGFRFQAKPAVYNFNVLVTKSSE